MTNASWTQPAYLSCVISTIAAVEPASISASASITLTITTVPGGVAAANTVGVPFVTPYHITDDGTQPTFVPVSSTNYIAIDSSTFVYLYNDSETDDSIIVSAYEADETGSFGCFACTLSAGDELLFGPFASMYVPILEVTHSYTSGVVMAAMTTTAFVLWVQATTPTTSSAAVSINRTVMNVAPTGDTYDGAASRDLYVVEPSLATAFDFPAPTGQGIDYVQIPSGLAIDNLQQITLEFIVYYRDGSTGNWPVIWDKSPLPNRWYLRAVDDPSSSQSFMLEYYMDCTGSSSIGNGYEYFTSPFSFIAGNYYYIQLTHDRSSVGNEPILKINNVTQTLTQNIEGSPTGLYSDAGVDMYLANGADALSGIGVDLLVYRVYNTILTDDELIANFNASSWRMGETNWVQVTVPNTTSEVDAPTFGGYSATWTQGTTPDTTSGSPAPLEYVGVTWSQSTTPDTISAAVTPLIEVPWGQITVPSTTSATFIPAVVGPSLVWTQTVVPTTSSSSFAAAPQGKGIVERVNVVFPTGPLEGYRIDGNTIPVISIEAKTDVTETERILTAPPQAQEFRLVGNRTPAPRIVCMVSEGA